MSGQKKPAVVADSGRRGGKGESNLSKMGKFQGVGGPGAAFLFPPQGKRLRIGRAFLFPVSKITSDGLIMTQFAADYYAHNCALIRLRFYKMHDSGPAMNRETP